MHTQDFFTTLPTPLKVIYKTNSEVPPSFHQHPYFEIYYFMGEKASYFIENQTFDLNKYDMIFIKPYVYHKTQYHCSTSFERFIISFNESLLQTIDNETIRSQILQLFEIKKISFTKSFNKYLKYIFIQKLLPSVSYASPISLLKSNYTFLEVLLSIVEALNEGDIQIGNTESTLPEQRISQIVSYINTHFFMDLSLDNLAQHFYTSKYYLCHIFKEVTGVTLIEYITIKRLTEAEKLLLNTNLTISSIASQVGFNNVGYFITLFKKKYGVTPKIFKNLFYRNDF